MPGRLFRLSELVARFGGELIGEDVLISRIAPLDEAGAGDLSFLANPKYRKQLQESHAAALLISASNADLSPLPKIVCDDPYVYFARVLALLNPPAEWPAGIRAGAQVASDAVIHPSASIGANAVIGARTVVGAGTIVYPGCVLGEDVTIGDDCRLYANITIYQGCRLGDRVTLHSGAVIGADGFGLAWNKSEWLKIPQVGAVRIGNDVEIGANTTVDRGALTDTVLEDGVKIDNQVQIAHNCHIGKHTAIAGCTGIAGSTRIGAWCTVGGAAMFVGHIEICDKVHIAGGALVSKSISKPGAYAGSYPIASREDWMKNAAHVRHLDRLASRVRELEKKLSGLAGEKE